MASLSLLLSVLITAIYGHDLLFFDEFSFDFDLNNADEWDNFNTNTDNTLNYASKCSDAIPLLFKHLCVSWQSNQGFKYKYKTPRHNQHMTDTDWYYNHDMHDRVSDAKTANQYYSELDNANNIRYIGDDSNWNEINYANKLSHFTLNDNSDNYFHNFAKGSFKQCRHSVRMRECVTFDLPSKQLNVNLKIARARKQKSDYQSMPSNINAAMSDMNDMYSEYDSEDSDYEDYEDNDYVDYEENDDYEEYDNYEEYEDYDDYGEYEEEYYEDEMEDNSAYDSHGAFEYGDSMGYDNWSADVMQWKSFQCINCNSNKRRALMDDEIDSMMFDKYGDYTYLYNEYTLDFDDANDWNEMSDDKHMKCSIAIPGFEHKLCVDTSNDNGMENGAKISFAAADQDDIDYGYYDMYGYDSYYYNIDHLYKNQQKRRLIYDYYDTDTDADTDSDDYDDDTDTDIYNENENDYDDSVMANDAYESGYNDGYNDFKGFDEDSDVTYDDLFGDVAYDAAYEDNQEYYEQMDQEYILNLRNELSDINLNFLDDDIWNDITTIYDAAHTKSIRKCKSFQVSRLCAVHSLSNPKKSLQFQLKIGKYKYHRSNNQKSDTSSAMANYINILSDDEDTTVDTQQHWIISEESIDISDSEWDDELIWVPSQFNILSNMLRKIVQHRCKAHTYCLCQYVDPSVDDGTKHPCAHAMPNQPQKVVHVMDDFVKAHKEFIPLIDYHKSPLHMEFHYKPHIEHLHVVGGLPFFHRRNHRKRYKVPWYKYSRYEGLRPNDRPKWLPHWMWREIGAHIHHDPRTVHRTARDWMRSGGIKFKRAQNGNIYARMKANGQKQGLVNKLKRTTKKIGDWFNTQGQNIKGAAKKTGNWFNKQGRRVKNMFSAGEDIYGDYDAEGESDEEWDGFMYYDYDEFLADDMDQQLADMEGDTSGMIDYLFPIMQKDGKDIMPVFEEMKNMVGSGNPLAENVGMRRRMENDDYYYEEDEDAVMDDWYDEDGSNWVMLSDELSYEDMSEFNNAEFDKIVKNVISANGRKIQRRCMRIFGRQICICQFLRFINAERADHLCYPKGNRKSVKTKYKTPALKNVRKRPKSVSKYIKTLKAWDIKKKSKVQIPKAKLKSDGLKIKTKYIKKLKKPTITKKYGKKPVKPIILGKKKSPPSYKQKIVRAAKKKKAEIKSVQKMSDKEVERLTQAMANKRKARKKMKAQFVKGKRKGKGPKKYKLWKHKDRHKLFKDNGGIWSDNAATQEKWIKKESNRIRRIVNDGLPKVRPLWFPHYFWHWLHSAPHFHVLRHKNRVPWTAASAQYEEGDTMNMNELSAAKELDYNWYQYGEDNEVDYDSVMDEVYSGETGEDDYSDLYQDFDEYQSDFEGLYAADGDLYEDYIGYESDLEDDYSDISDRFYGDYEEEYGEMDDMYYSDGLEMNALENGKDYLGGDDDISEEMWRVETMFLFMFVAALFCLLAFCFVWKSKWGDLIRKLNQERMNRNNRIAAARKRMQMLKQMSDENEESSSFNISDVEVAPFNNNHV